MLDLIGLMVVFVLQEQDFYEIIKVIITHIHSFDIMSWVI